MTGNETHHFLSCSIWESSVVWCGSHGDVLFISPSSTEAAGRNSVSWCLPAAAPLLSIPTFELSPSSQAVPSQWLSTASVQGPGHCCPVQNLSMGNLCAGTSHWAAQNFLKAALQSDILFMLNPVFPPPFSLVWSVSWFEGFPYLLLLCLPFLVHRAHPQ